MVKLTRWCIAHRRRVFVGWIVVVIAVNVIAQAVGRQYSTDFTLPGTQSQRVADLLSHQFKSQGGDVDTIVFHYAHGHYDAPAVKQAISHLLRQVKDDPHVSSVLSPYTTAGAVQVAKDHRTAFATINYSKRANLLPDDTGKPVLRQIKAIKISGLRIAAGGQVIEQAEGFSVGPATAVGAIAALVILLLTFGSIAAAGVPLVTAGAGLISGLALLGLATRVTSMSNITPDLALMIGLGVGIDYALFIVTRFRESYARNGSVEDAVIEAMDTSGRAIILAGATVIIALLGMFATGLSFMYGLSVGSVLAVLLVLLASLTLVPALLSRFGHRMVRPSRRAQRCARRRDQRVQVAEGSGWRRWSLFVQHRPRSLVVVSLAVMVAILIPFFAMRLDTSDAGNDPAGTSTHQAFDLIAQGFGPGFNGPLLVVVEMPHGSHAALPPVRRLLKRTANIDAVSPAKLSPSGRVAVMEAYPNSAPQDVATTKLVHRLREQVLPPLARKFGVAVSVGGFTAGSIDFSHVLAAKLPLFIAIVVVLSVLLLFVLFRSLVIPVQAGLMNLLSIGSALGATVAVFQWGWGASIVGVSKGPIEPWIPVLMFAVVFGLSMDYEVFLISRVREEWVHRGDASQAVADGLAFTGRVITAAAAIMVCVFLSFLLGDERTIKEFGFGLAVAVFLDALVVRCVMLPSVLELLGRTTWRIPGWLETHLPHINIEGNSPARFDPPDASGPGESEAPEPEPVSS